MREQKTPTRDGVRGLYDGSVVPPCQVMDFLREDVLGSYIASMRDKIMASVPSCDVLVPRGDDVSQEQIDRHVKVIRWKPIQEVTLMETSGACAAYRRFEFYDGKAYISKRVSALDLATKRIEKCAVENKALFRNQKDRPPE